MDTINLAQYISNWNDMLPGISMAPWDTVARIPDLIREKLDALDSEFKITGDIAIHRDARVEEHVIMKGPIIISSGCFVGAHAYLRGGIMLGSDVSVGPGCEIKSSIIFSRTALAHFNFVGDSLLGAGVNMEAGAVIANHFNERADKRVHIHLNGSRVSTGVSKFGALVGDGTRIGANAVLSPGTILNPGSIVGRLELVDQDAGQ